MRALSDPNGNVTDSYDYDAFGNLIHSSTTLSSPTPNNYLFAGEQFDPDLNLYYNRARYLNVSTGRFWSMDEFEGYSDDPGSLHQYLYVGADPANAFDRSGHDFDLVSTLGAAAITGFLASTSTSLYLGNGLWKSLGYGLAGAAGAVTLTAGVLTGGAAVAAVFGVPAITGVQVVGGVAGSYFGATSIQRFLNASGGRPKDVATVGMIMALTPFFVPVVTGTPDVATEAELINALAVKADAGGTRNVAYLVSEIDGNSGFSYTVSGTASNRSGNPVNMPSNPRFSPDPGFEAHAEVKLLEDLAGRINPGSQGRAVIVQRTDYVCTSCQLVIQQFKQMFPGISLDVRTAADRLAANPFD